MAKNQGITSTATQNLKNNIYGKDIKQNERILVTQIPFQSNSMHTITIQGPGVRASKASRTAHRSQGGGLHLCEITKGSCCGPLWALPTPPLPPGVQERRVSASDERSTQRQIRWNALRVPQRALRILDQGASRTRWHHYSYHASYASIIKYSHHHTKVILIIIVDPKKWRKIC
jgi:hypothetical protein